jgi:phospholipase/lecithinase/hemolysin
MFIAQGTATTKSVKADILAWNAQVSAQAAQWQVDHTNSNVMVLDTQPIFTYILNHPKQYGKTNLATIPDPS